MIMKVKLLCLPQHNLKMKRVYTNNDHYSSKKFSLEFSNNSTAITMEDTKLKSSKADDAQNPDFSLDIEKQQILITGSNCDNKLISGVCKSIYVSDYLNTTNTSLNFQKPKTYSVSSDDIIGESFNSSHYSISICDSESSSGSLYMQYDDKVLDPLKYDLEASSRATSLKEARRLKKLRNKKYHENDNIYFRPNYFVGIQISNPDIHKAVIDVQKSLLDANISIMPSLVDVATLHITLLVAHIQNDDQLFDACSALDHCGAILSEELSSGPVQLSFRGISNFSHKTIFAKLVEDHHYMKLQHIGHILKEEFYKMNIAMPNQRELLPHLTIAKLSKMPRGKGKTLLRKIEPGYYQQFLDYEFGTQVLSGIQLLSMNKPKDQNRYYYNSRQVSFDVVPVESLDHSGCCFPRQPQLLKFHKVNSPNRSSQNCNPSSNKTDSVMKAFVGGVAILSMTHRLFKNISRRLLMLT